MQLALFFMILAMCIMVLKTESSSTFKEPGFNFNNKNIHDYLKEQAPELRKICQGTQKSYIWELPIADHESKALKFAEVVRKKGKFLSQTSWELTSINEITNFDPFQEPTLTINFQIRKKEKEIYLDNLFPTFPKVSGVDILQFLMSLSYACDFTLSLNDESDISISYKLLTGAGYYSNLIKGLGTKRANQNKIIFKNNFYKCAQYELLNLNQLHQVVRINETLNACQEKDISVQDCPVHFLWLGRVMHYNFMPKILCCGNWPANLYESQEFNFPILPKDLSRIFNKIPVARPILSYPIIKNCTPTVKDFETVQKDVIHLNFLKLHLIFVFLIQNLLH